MRPAEVVEGHERDRRRHPSNSGIRRPVEISPPKIVNSAHSRRPSDSNDVDLDTLRREHLLETYRMLNGEFGGPGDRCFIL